VFAGGAPLRTSTREGIAASDPYPGNPDTVIPAEWFNKAEVDVAVETELSGLRRRERSDGRDC
jgi:hypothetical protein